MKRKKFSIFRRIVFLVFSLVAILCLLFMWLTYFSVTNYHQASTQLLNKDVAAHIASFTSPFENNGINKEKADSVFYNAMVISPSAEVYFLDSLGKVIAFHANEKAVKQWIIPLDHLKKLMAAKGQAYIKGPDPREPGHPKIFSAAEVKNGSKKLGYIYVILGSNQQVTSSLYASYFSSLLLKVALVVICLSVFFTLLYLNRFQKSFNRVIDTLERFQNGDLEARFAVKEGDELEPVTTAFNKMAGLLSYHIDRLTKSEQERKDFIANISHDLRTPLSIARGYTETLLLKKTPPHSSQEQEEFLQLVYKKVRQVEHMVEQLFHLSKMESAEFVPHKEPFIFSEILLEVIHSSALSAAEKNISIDCTRCEAASWILADVSMMERAVQNLVVNAIKYTPQNGHITVTLQNEPSELFFQITNSGPPLSPALLEWSNLPDSTSLTNKRPAKSGIGLMIVKKILRLHQFTFKAESDINTGNKFIIRMPVLQNKM